MSLAWFADPDTRFLGASIGQPNDWAALAVDLSPYGESLTPQGNPSNRAVFGPISDYTTPHAPTVGLNEKCVEALVTMGNSVGVGARRLTLQRESGSLNAAGAFTIMHHSDSNTLRCLHQNTQTVGTAFVPPGLVNAQRRFYLAWSVAINPNATGAADAMLSRLMVWNLHTGEFADIVQATAVQGIPGNKLSIGGSNSGETWDRDGNAMEMIRISDRPRSRQEIEAYIPAVLASFPRQGHVWTAKQGQRYLGIRSAEQGLDVLAQDRSQYASHWTDGADYIRRADANANLKPLARPWGFYCVADFDPSTDTGTLYGAAGTGSQYRLRVSAGGMLAVQVNTVTVAEFELPADERRWLIGWFVLDNPDTTGASDEVITELVAYAEGVGALRARAAHEMASIQTNHDVFVSRYNLTTDPFSGTIVAAGITHRALTLAELVADWYAYAPRQEDDQVETLRQPVPLTRQSGAGNVGELAGLAPQWSALAHKKAIRRHFSPLVNERFWQPEEMLPYIDAPAGHIPWIVAAPGGDGFRICGWWLFERPVPPACNVAWVRAHIYQWHASGSGSGDVTVDLRLFSMSRRPAQAGPLDFRFVTASRTANDEATSTPGAHVFEELLPLVRTQDDATVIALAYRVPSQTAGSRVRFRVGDLAVCPRFAPVVNGNNPQGGGGGGFGF